MPGGQWSLLEGLPDDVVRALLAGSRRRRFARGEVLFHEGDPADTLHLIDRGSVAIRTATPLGEVTTLNFQGPGEAVGELALIGPPAPRSATAVAMEPTETMAVPRREFDRLLEEHPRVLEVLVRILADRVRELSDQVLEARYVPADVRVRRQVLQLSGREGAVAVTQEDLAGLVGTTRGTVNRVIRDEVARGALRTERGRITVLDGAAIARRAR